MTRMLPGCTIGIFGGGQLARMIALEARRMGYRIAVLDPDPQGSAAQVADLCVTGSLQDPSAARALAEVSDVITLDTEHVPAALLAEIEALCPLRPASAVLRVIQDRIAQRRFLESLGAPQARFAEVSDVEGLRAAAEALGYPCVLKTRHAGYDGKGQRRLDGPEALEPAWRSVGGEPCVLESFVRFQREISVLLARGLDGEVRFYAIAENDHRHHILHLTRVPARLAPETAAAAEALGAGIAEALGHIGMLAVEMFETVDGRLLVNEIAPRTHNSGHFTFGACATSQFEQHVRAICGLPLGDTTLLRPAAMLNLLGDLWAGGTPDFGAALAHPWARLHLYGKRNPLPKRKMGHVLVTGDDPDRVAAIAEGIFRQLANGTEDGPHDL